MNVFLQRHAASVIGVLHGFDRLLCRGTQRLLATAAGLMRYLWSAQVLLKDFGDWSQSLTEQVRSASEQVMRDANRPLIYLRDASASKEEMARRIARDEGIKTGRVCLLSSVEPCWSYEVHRSRSERKLILEPRYRKCLHLYHYLMHPQLGLMHARLQTWLPFTMKLCINGREWLGRSLESAGAAYVKKENCLTWVADVAGAQEMLDRQLRTDWPALLGDITRQTNPAFEQVMRMGGRPLEYYWSVDQSEWASDVMFKSPAALAGMYPKLIRQGITTLGSVEVMRFLGKRLTAEGRINGHFAGEVVSDLRQRAEGMRLKHRVNANSVKMYDKQGSVLRVETTINNPRDLKVYRGTEADPQKKQWRAMRKGVADLHRRAEVSQSSNERYLAALGAMDCQASVGEMLEPLGRGMQVQGRRYRGLQVMGPEDGKLLAAVARGEFAINGFRNRDIRVLLMGPEPQRVEEARRRSGRISRKLALLRAHGLIRRVPKTRRWMLTNKGQQVVTLLSAAKAASARLLMEKAA
jgi:hypothetical protein